MLSTDGYVKILDFGIARATFASALERRRLRGKPRYMAPEQTLGEPPTAASDVFALGIIAWELFTGLPLYRGTDLKSILEAVRRTDPPRIDRMNPQVPTEIVDAVATALAPRAAARAARRRTSRAACARTAMAAGARRSRRGSATSSARPSSAAIPWQPEVTSISVPGPGDAGGADDDHEPALAMRSVTRSLSDVSAPHAAPLSAPIAVPPRASDPGAEAPTERATPRPTLLGSMVRARAETAGAPTERFVRVDRAPVDRADTAEPTATAIGTLELERGGRAPGGPAGRFSPGGVIPRTDVSAATGVMRRFAPDGIIPRTEVTTTAADGIPRRIAEPTVSLGEPVTHDPSATVPYERASFDVLALGPSLRPSALQLDEEITTHGMAPPPVGPEDTSYDELDVDPSIDDDPAALAARARRFDEPIDDDLGAMASGLPAERRRTVVVAGVLAGAPPDVLRTVTRSLGELAYQRGGVVLELDDDALARRVRPRGRRRGRRRGRDGLGARCRRDGARRRRRRRGRPRAADRRAHRRAGAGRARGGSAAGPAAGRDRRGAGRSRARRRPIGRCSSAAPAG